MTADAAAILVVNAGSSSLKFKAYALVAGGRLEVMGDGQFEGLGTAPRLRARAGGAPVAARDWPTGARLDHAAAVAELRRLAPALLAGRRLAAIGHRVVHGGGRPGNGV